MIVLAADTSTAYNSVAVCEFPDPASASGERILAEAVIHVNRRHAEGLLDTTDRLLTQAAVLPKDVELLAVSSGPGSFTGLRVGVATWKGLALGLSLPLIGVPTLDALTRAVSTDTGTVCTLLDARMNEVFGAVYSFRNGRREKLTADRVCPVEDILRDLPPGTLFIGDGALLYRDEIAGAVKGARFAPGRSAAPRASAVAAEARALAQQGADTDARALVPVYLRMSQPEELRKRAPQEAGAG